jgi:putative membrane protein
MRNLEHGIIVAALRFTKSDRPIVRGTNDSRRLAEKNGQSGQVKNFGETLKTDHGNANMKAIEAAKSLNVVVPTEPNANQKADYNEMAKLKGPDFDKKFAEHMVMDHKKDIEKYQTAGRQQDAAGKYATESLPTLQKHLQTAEAIQKDTVSR